MQGTRTSYAFHPNRNQGKLTRNVRQGSRRLMFPSDDETTWVFMNKGWLAATWRRVERRRRIPSPGTFTWLCQPSAHCTPSYRLLTRAVLPE